MHMIQVQVAIRSAQGLQALMDLVADCLVPLEKELVQARRTSIMAASPVISFDLDYLCSCHGNIEVQADVALHSCC